MPLVAAEDASDKQSQHHVEQYHAVLRYSAGSALQVRQRNTATLLGGGYEMLCTNCLVARTGRKMADCKAEKKKRRCCLVLVIVQRILPEKSGLREGQAVEKRRRRWAVLCQVEEEGGGQPSSVEGIQPNAARCG